ncbi:hypothetical protein HDU97_008292 [Phlyctochytrium planicorne]|nr:hypothetical protein HDU97_008292 [Phlyctochytrium planicorne]
MTLKEETTCIATPGFAGFVPSLKYQFGLTYGNATRHILQTDSSLKQGHIQKEHSRHIAEIRARREVAGPSSSEEEYVWKKGNKYATADDRFSFPPVPGYTGYIPRSQEHFGRPYVEATSASLADFMSMLKSKSELPARIRAIKNEQKPIISAKVSKKDNKAAGNKTGSSNAAAAAAAGGEAASPSKPTFAYSAASSPIDEKSPYKLPPHHVEKTFISGYTGFVPRLQNHFGEPYSDSVRKAIDDFTAPRPSRDLYKEPFKIQKIKSITKTHPIPGFTGFIPGSKYGFATTFGKTTEIAYENFNNRDEKGRIQTHHITQLPQKDLSQSLPIPGYRGHIPNYIFAAERSYGVSSKECINGFATQRSGKINV